MQLFCPACQSPFPSASRCPRCGGLLLMPHEVAAEPARRPAEEPAPLNPTAFGRVAVGTVLAMGAYLAVRKLTAGLVLATEPDPLGWWLSVQGLSTVYSLQTFAVVFGAVLAAAGRAGGYSLGAAVGLVCGGLFLGYELLSGAPARDLVLYLQLPVLVMSGLVAGAAGSRVWGEAPKLDLPVPNSGSKLSSICLVEDAAVDRSRPTEWVRVLVGAVLMVAGVAVADQARVFAQKYSGGILRVQGLAQAEFITWQLASFAVLLGGVLAGAATGAGVRHGILAGLLGGTAVFVMYARLDAAIPPVTYWLGWLSLADRPLMTPAVVTGIAGSVLLAGIVGGWLGGALFLPLAPEHMRRRLQTGMD